MTINVPGTIDLPIFDILSVVATGIAYKGFDLPIDVSAGCHPEYLIIDHPQYYLTITSGAITVCCLRIGKPYPTFEPKCLICQRTYRANIDHVATHIIFYSLMYVSTDLGVDTSAQDSMNPTISELLSYKYTSVAKYTAVHM